MATPSGAGGVLPGQQGGSFRRTVTVKRNLGQFLRDMATASMAILALVLVAAILGDIFIGLTWTNTNQLKTDVNAVSVQVRELNATFSTDVAELTAEIVVLIGDVETLTTDVETLITDVESLNATVITDLTTILTRLTLTANAGCAGGNVCSAGYTDSLGNCLELYKQNGTTCPVTICNATCDISGDCTITSGSCNGQGSCTGGSCAGSCVEFETCPNTDSLQLVDNTDTSIIDLVACEEHCCIYRSEVLLTANIPVFATAVLTGGSSNPITPQDAGAESVIGPYCQSLTLGTPFGACLEASWLAFGGNSTTQFNCFWNFACAQPVYGA